MEVHNDGGPHSSWFELAPQNLVQIHSHRPQLLSPVSDPTKTPVRIRTESEVLRLSRGIFGHATGLGFTLEGEAFQERFTRGVRVLRVLQSVQGLGLALITGGLTQ